MKLLKVLVVWGWSCQKAQSADYGYQSGAFRTQVDSSDHDVSNSFASSLHYDPVNKAAYVVGSTYWSYWDRIIHSEEQIKNLAELDESDCFLAIISVPTDGDTMFLDYSRRFGTSGIDEACTAISVVHNPNGKTRVITSGHAEEGGFLTSLRNLGAPTSTVYGFMLDLELRGNSVGKLHGGGLMNDHTVQYPLAIAFDSRPKDGDDEAFYVVALSSLIESKNPLNAEGSKDPRPDKALGGVEQPEYGSHFSAFIKKMVPKTQAQLDYEESDAEVFDLTNDEGGLKETMRAGWTELLSPRISLDSISMEHYLQVSDLKYVPRVKTNATDDSLVLVGTTSGYGEAFGGDIEDENIQDESFRYSAGFVTVFDLNGAIEAATRIEVDEEDVVIRGVCFDQGADSVDFLYVVGETRGLLADNMKVQDLSKDPSGIHSKHAFLTKIDLSDLSRVWTRQLGGTLGNNVIAEGCAVSPGNDVVYMAGTVIGGDTIRQDTNDISSAGGDDIFVANYNSATGTPKYIKQIGSPKDDWLAKGNGIATDEMGNALLLGNSKGSMMRWRGEEEESSSTTISRDLPSDIFLFSVEKLTGSTKPVPSIYSPGPTTIPDKKNSDSGNRTLIIIAAIFGSTLLSVAVLAVHKVVKIRRRDQQSESVVDYLDDFQDNAGFEVHIRNSAAGGVHAVYGNRNMGIQSLNDTGRHSYSVDSEIAEVTRDTNNMRRPGRGLPIRGAFGGDISLDSASVLSYDASSMVSEDLSFGHSVI